ncbi:Stp1/IreP family PP2C-type Ser/Thr phosphatase [Alkalibacter rhizosphaerae]|uniref:Stp1/IreP family PP2C-type Ser/Thr phosphatase n=1 Tax=Alkalibacter rhizosphaerae TaxID=2815577 RepID=A0A974XF92_9FIRM|nr:Stp1/IreP family PP2C-type Ser/Thr phosphatase [Alkalibacter rhizosphaerae]QSX08743.1 Stp1/IreP family PP2C-type Ser/Thr phosphatase [Alkalibacter rhizosphaerae]
MKVGHGSHIGKIRKLNQDAYWVGTSKDGRPVLAVADGLGGHRAGEVASQMLVTAIETFAETHQWDQVDLLKRDWVNAIQRANREIYEAGRSDEKLAGMGTTLTMMIQSGSHIHVFHVGDTRLYRIRKDGMEKVTKDHTLVESLLESGEISLEEARQHPNRNMLMRAIGTDPTLEVDVLDLDWVEEDLYLLCSDGLTNYVDEQQIWEIIKMTDQPSDSVQQLIDAANAHGGGDNITAIIYKPEVIG